MNRRSRHNMLSDEGHGQMTSKLDTCQPPSAGERCSMRSSLSRLDGYSAQLIYDLISRASISRCTRSSAPDQALTSFVP
jgi:hypothetical protein